jgi:hypothetical protein
LPELGDLDVEDVDELDLAGHDRRVGVLHRPRLTQLIRLQRLLDRGSPAVEVASAGASQRGDNGEPGQPGSPVRIGRPVQQFECLARGQVVEGLQRGGEELAQRRPQPQHLPGAIPDQALMGPGHQFDCFGESAVTGNLAVVGVVQAHDLGEDVGVTGVGLRARGGMSFAVSGHGHRVDREYLVARGEQRLHPGSAVGLDPDLHPCGGVRRLEVRPRGGHMLRDQRMQPADALQTLGQSGTGQPTSVVVEELDVMVVFGPVISDPDHPRLQCRHRGGDSSAEETPAI